MEKQLVIFKLANESFGIEIAYVEGINKLQDITKIPNSPEYVEGVINLRGVVLPVIDLEKRFGIPPHERNNETRIVIINMGQLKTGMIVSSVSEVLTIDDSIIEPPPPIVTTVKSSYITGIAHTDNRMIILLDMNRVLSQEEQLQAATLAI